MADELKNALVELVRELSAAGIEVYLGGGYGLYLKQLALLESETRTYIDREAWPRPRATADLDVFLPREIIIDHAHMARVRKALDDLRYEAVDLQRISAGEGRSEQLDPHLAGGIDRDLVAAQQWVFSAGKLAARSACGRDPPGPTLG